ncbi:hypothetical protein BT67DRAFT_441703, partial [Trichocladium antarcticum]
ATLLGAGCSRVAGSWELGVAGWAALPGAGCSRPGGPGCRELGVAGLPGAGSWVRPGRPRCQELGTAKWVALLGAGYSRVKVGYYDKTTYVERAIVGIASKN